MTATPNAPVAKVSATRSGPMPPIAITGMWTARATWPRAVRPRPGSSWMRGSLEDVAEGDVVGSLLLGPERFLDAMDRHAEM